MILVTSTRWKPVSLWYWLLVCDKSTRHYDTGYQYTMKARVTMILVKCSLTVPNAIPVPKCSNRQIKCLSQPWNALLSSLIWMRKVTIVWLWALSTGWDVSYIWTVQAIQRETSRKQGNRNRLRTLMKRKIGIHRTIYTIVIKDEIWMHDLQIKLFQLSGKIQKQRKHYVKMNLYMIISHYNHKTSICINDKHYISA